MARGTIKDGEEVLFENIEISLTTGRSSDGFTYWHGSFRITPHGYIDLAGENYRLELDDGRVGKINIRHFDESTGLVLFRGTGELKRPEPPTQAEQDT